MDEPAIETFTEWRLTGLPPGFPPYDMITMHEPTADQLKAIWAKIQSGEHAWTNARFGSRQVTIFRTPWVDDADPTQPQDRTTTVEDELALAIGAAVTVGLSPNRIAHLLVTTGWQNPTLPYLNDLEATRD